MVSFAAFLVAELRAGSSGVPRLPSWVTAGKDGGLAGSGTVLAGESKSLRLSEQSEETWDHRTLGAAI